MVNQKIVFLYALIFAIFIFAVGFFIGFSIENLRNDIAYQTYIKSEISLFDARIQNNIFNSFPIKNCEKAVEQNVMFGDKIYEEAKILERYERANKISEVIVAEHKKFDLLRTLFWINSMNIKKKCNASYVDIVYFYKYNKPTTEQKAFQTVYSDMLMQIKNEFGGSILLIPISGDNNLTSVESLMNYYNITKLPSILINEKIKIDEPIKKQELEKIITDELNKNQNNSK